jgi:hypothetical protein
MSDEACISPGDELLSHEMHPVVATNDPTAVEMEVQAAYQAMFRDVEILFVPRVFGWVIECFTGNFRDYQAVDTRYHDFEHTLQGTLCMARLLRGRHAAEAQPRLAPKMFQLGIVAILLHDTGYLKQRGDTEGTGAKYTVTHVGRSATFAARLLGEKGFNSGDIQAVQNMISCTGVNANLDAIPFQNEMEKIVGFALATADLLGQMAAEDYVEKLPVLYEEFAEAASYSKEGAQFVATYTSATDLLKKTPMFWKNYVLARLDREFRGLYRFLSDPYPSGPNYYLERVEANMERLKRRLASVGA